MRQAVTIPALLVLIILFGCKMDESDTLPPDKVFIKFYGGTGTEKAADFVKRDDGGFVLFGTTTSGASDQSENYFVVFTDAYGNQEGHSIVIDRVITDATDEKIPTTETASRIKRVSDGYILVGSSAYQVPGKSFTQSDIFVAKVFDDRTYQTFVVGEVYDAPDELRPSNEFGQDIVEIAGGYILAGSTNDTRITGSVASGSDIYAAKLNRQLNEIADWFNVPSISGDEAAFGLEMNGANVVLVGTTTIASPTSGGGNTNIFYQERDTATLGVRGGFLAGNSKNETPSRIRRNADGDYYLTGNATNINTGARNAFVMRIISSTVVDHYEINLGEERNEQILANDILRLPGSNYLLIGERLATVDLRGSEMLLARVTPTGEVDESFGDGEGLRYFGGAANDRAVALQRLDDGSIVLLGTVDLDANGNTYMCLVKTNSNGILGK